MDRFSGVRPTGWPKKVSHRKFFNKLIVLKIANEIRFLRKVKV